ncbi:MAG: hypothetical protein J5496_09350 [Lachnospiraceae bacterium]|nr:hypothetical protein [Lachnospiraceae bacterium]
MSLPFRVYPIRRDEVLRRSALRNPSPDETKLAEEVMRDGAYLLEYHITERPRPMDLVTEPVLKEALTGCDSVIVFTATLGRPFQEQAESHEEPEKDLIWQGLAAERLDALVESYLDYKEKVFEAAGAVLTAHYPFRWEGVEENAFTATRIVGIGFHPEQVRGSRCRTCFVTDCPSRREAAQDN